MTKFLNISTDNTLGGNSPSDVIVASQKAIKDYVDSNTGGGSYHPELFSHEWDDHERNNMSWVNALTFSWQNRTDHEVAYQHLVDDYNNVSYVSIRFTLHGETIVCTRNAQHDIVSSGVQYYAWERNDISDSFVYTTSVTPGIGSTIYNSSLSALTVVSGFVDGSSTETIAGITITYYQAPDGHKLVLQDQESNVEAIYLATGIAWYYILDETNQRFKLPRSRFQVDTTKLIKSLDNSNKTAISFPYTATEDGYVGACFKYVDGTIGSISVNNIVVFNNTSRYNGSYLIGFESVGIYVKKGDIITISGFSNDTSYFMPYETVTTDQRLYFYVGNYTQTAIENTAGLNASLFNNKADLDLANVLSNIDFVVDSQLPTAANNYTWYRKYKSGWVEQGGVITTNAIVYLPITMSDTNYTITTGNNHYSDGAGTPVVVYYNKQVGLFEIQGRWNGGAVSGLSANWAVFGVAA